MLNQQIQKNNLTTPPSVPTPKPKVRPSIHSCFFFKDLSRLEYLPNKRRRTKENENY